MKELQAIYDVGYVLGVGSHDFNARNSRVESTMLGLYDGAGFQLRRYRGGGLPIGSGFRFFNHSSLMETIPPSMEIPSKFPIAYFYRQNFITSNMGFVEKILKFPWYGNIE
jgi:hypothetical protein